MTIEQLKSEVESGNMDHAAEYARALAVQQAQLARASDPRIQLMIAHDRSEQLKSAIVEALYYLRLGETGRATEILNQALSA